MIESLPWEYRDALGYDGLPVDEDKAISLIQISGLDATNQLGDTPLSTAAMLGRTKTIQWLLENGAAVDYVVPDSDGKTPLLWACEQKRLAAAEILLDHGADIEAVDRFNNTPLATTFVNCFADPLPLATMLVRRGANIADRVKQLGVDWNSDRFKEFLASINSNGVSIQDLPEPSHPLPDTDISVSPSPVPREIDLTGSDNDVARWIWKTLVPKSGQASFVQAEVLRAIEKLRWEAQGTGNINWDDRFKMLVDYIETTLTMQSCFSSETKESIRHDLDRLRNFLPPNELRDDSQIPALPYVDDDLYDRLTGHLVSFCRHHPQLIPHDADPEQYR